MTTQEYLEKMDRDGWVMRTGPDDDIFFTPLCRNLGALRNCLDLVIRAIANNQTERGVSIPLVESDLAKSRREATHELLHAGANPWLEQVGSLVVITNQRESIGFQHTTTAPLTRRQDAVISIAPAVLSLPLSPFDKQKIDRYTRSHNIRAELYREAGTLVRASFAKYNLNFDNPL